MAWRGALAELRACLAALSGRGAELIVVRACEAAELEELRRGHADVRFVRCEPGASIAQLRAAGMRAASGDVVALAEDDCARTREWLDEVLRSYRRTRTE